jgi:hypothetical protein
MVVMELLQKEAHPGCEPWLELSCIQAAFAQLRRARAKRRRQVAKSGVAVQPEPAERAKVWMCWPSGPRVSIDEQAEIVGPTRATVEVE